MNLENTAANQATPLPFAALDDYQFVQLTTYRKNSVGVPTQVWFARADGTIYVITPAQTGKLKRIRNNGRATLAPCKANGEVLGGSIECSARILDVQEEQLARQALIHKYGLLFRIFSAAQRLRRIQRKFIAIQPVQP